MLIIHLCGVDITINGIDVFKGITSTFIMAFLLDGVSIVWQIEKLGLGYATLIHGSILYLSYLVVYLFNNWIPKSPISILLFSIGAIGTYIIIWLIIYIINKLNAKKLNKLLS